MRPIPISYTFGNHMHWVDMEWLWGYHVLPGSVRDMLRFCRETGAKGCVNFDGIGYEKLAIEDPEAFAELREAVRSRLIEPVGCSYGQPYGLFHGGESNIRQRIYGVRTVLRLFGVRPKTFWEEEFDFFPQLPQILKGCGFDYASLFFQWTWHTPEIPTEEAPAIWWEGVDGTRLLAATRNKLNLHQWPEDFDPLLDELSNGKETAGEDRPLIQQWLELMPSPDWMCRSEVLLPRMKELIGDPRFDIELTTLGGYLQRASSPSLPVRKYALDDIWHGFSLGKNFDRMRRASRRTEQILLSAESLAASISLFGRPYGQWDVYPAWELEEAWRELLQAQHHDNDECEGLCGHVGWQSYERAGGLAQAALENLERRLCQRVRLGPEDWLTFNGTEPPAFARPKESSPGSPISWKPLEGAEVSLPREEKPQIEVQDEVVRLHFAEASVTVSVPEFEILTDGKPRKVRLRPKVAKDGFELIGSAKGFKFALRASAYRGGVIFDVSADFTEGYTTLRSGFGGAIRIRFEPEFSVASLHVDSPYADVEIGEGSSGKRKYPEGDWMTSPQWFEEVQGAFTSQRYVDLIGKSGEGVLVAHDGSQQWFRTDRGVECVATLRDPWDEDRVKLSGCATMNLVAHRGLRPHERFLLASAGMGSLSWPGKWDSEARDIPPSFAPLRIEPEGVLVGAFYRELEDFAGKGLENYAGKGMGHPFVLRLVEYDGFPAEVDLVIAGPIAKAFKTNLMGEVERELVPEDLSPEELAENPLRATAEDLEPFGIVPQRLRFNMRPREIATLYLDLVPGRKQARDLDAKREVWATVHRI
jgi:alpha-mannosidase